MTTKEIENIIDKSFTKELQKLGLGYIVIKVKNEQAWECSIGKFNNIQDPWIKGELLSQVKESIDTQFQFILKFAIEDELVNYSEQV